MQRINTSHQSGWFPPINSKSLVLCWSGSFQVCVNRCVTHWINSKFRQAISEITSTLDICQTLKALNIKIQVVTMFVISGVKGTLGEGEEVVQRLGPGCHKATAASQGQSGAADQRARDCEDTTGAPGRKSEPTFEAFSTLNESKGFGATYSCWVWFENQRRAGGKPSPRGGSPGFVM